MVAAATFSLRPCAPPRTAPPRARAWFAPATRATPTVAVSYAARPFGGIRRAVAVDSDQQGSPEPPEQVRFSSCHVPLRSLARAQNSDVVIFPVAFAQEKKPKTYYFLVANAKFMLDEEEHFQEQLAEKLRNYAERDKERDFWLVIEPKFLDRFPNITKRLKRPAAALVSTDGNWIT